MLPNILYHLKRPFHLVKTGLLKGLPAEIKHGFPAKKLKIIALTGTDGKTTTSTVLYHILKTAGVKVALLSTVAAYINDEEIDTGFHVTSPNPKDLHQILAKMVDQDIEVVVLETTSHGIYQFRTWGIKPMIAGVTNISEEHLDYHVTYDNYVSAKAEILQRANLAIINGDDRSATKLRKKLRSSKTPFEVISSQDRLYSQATSAIRTKFPEDYNRMNARLAYAISQKLSVSNNDFIAGIESFPGIPGRMDEISSKPVRVIVDFAHTSQGLEAALTALRDDMPKKSKLIAVFGCAGLRDREKRPKMGKAASELADFAVFTAEDPRTENIWTIIDQMKGGVTNNHHKIISIADRLEAIEHAIVDLAKDGDVVGIFGKGHEKSMCFGTTEYEWSDHQVARQALKKRKEVT